MTNECFKEWLIKHDTCEKAVKWIGERDLATAWIECERADWMLWLTDEAEVDYRLVAPTVCEIVRKVLHLVPDGEDRPRDAIDTLERWARYRATNKELRKAAVAAGAADADAEAAAWATRAAAWATRAAWAAAANAAAAWGAAATDAAADAAAWADFHREAADMLRKAIPLQLIIDAMKVKLLADLEPAKGPGDD